MMRTKLTILMCLASCGDAATEPVDGATPDDQKGDRAGDLYHTVDGAPLAAHAHDDLAAALVYLADIGDGGSSGRQKRLAAETVARIAEGKVLIGALERARGLDLWHMCKDIEDGEPLQDAPPVTCPAEPPTDAAWAGDEVMRAGLVAQLDGYQWGNRLYFRFDAPEAQAGDAADVTPQALAATLVHEVNHVLNRSECSYYEDYFAHAVDPTLAWLEEYRAFLTECVLARGSGATATRCDQWAATQVDERGYDMTPDLMALVGDDPLGRRAIAEALWDEDGRFGWLGPALEVWPSDFSACETFGAPAEGEEAE